MNKLLLGDSLDVLKEIESESVDLLCTDPPYGYSFMGKSWDKTLPDIGIFKECHRVLKPGAFAFVMSAPRSDVCARMMLMLEDAGFEIGFTPIYWTYASGFPKAMNIGKMVDKRLGLERKGTIKTDGSATGSVVTDLNPDNNSLQRVYETGDPVSDAAKALDGSYGGFQPKPAVEVVIVAMKPLSEKTYVDQALKNGKGITWLDDCRVPTAVGDYASGGENNTVAFHTSTATKTERTQQHEGGRFPANLLVSDDVLTNGEYGHSAGSARGAEAKQDAPDSIFYGDKGSPNNGMRFGDSGGYSRFFSLDAWAKTLPFLIVPKAAKSEKNAGLDELPKKQKVFNGQSGKPSKDVKDVEARMMTKPSANFHPTVKPLKLMSYLITLGSRPGDVVLDPFLGSGTTAVATKQLGRKYIGIEREAEYVEIARARVDATSEQTPNLFSI